MFFNKKKTKIDPKIRFQNRQFNQKLHEARTFKRTAKPVAESEFERFLYKIGLGSRWMQIFVALIALGIIYVIYAPNFLTLQNITVEGLPYADRILVEEVIQDDLNAQPFYNPQRNIFFLSKKRVNLAALSIPGVDSVEKITKNFSNQTLYVSVKPKHERFLVRSADQVFDIYNDGTLKGVAGLHRDAWLGVQNPGMAKVELVAKVATQDTRQFFSDSTVRYMIKLQEALKGIVGSPLAYYSIRIPELKQQQDLIETARQLQEALAKNEEEVVLDEDTDGEETVVEEVPPEQQLPIVDISLPINADELDIFLQKGDNPIRTFKVIVDTKEDPEQLVQRLNLLLSQTAQDRYSQLSYIDLRIQSRAFVCLLNTVCNR